MHDVVYDYFILYTLKLYLCTHQKVAFAEDCMVYIYRSYNMQANWFRID